MAKHGTKSGHFISLILTGIFLIFSNEIQAVSSIQVGVDVFFSKGHEHHLTGKQVGLVTNHTAMNCAMQSTIEIVKKSAKTQNFRLVALFGPEHGIDGMAHADNAVAHTVDEDNIPIYSLYGPTRRPTPQMLSGIDVLLFDMMDIGVRSYTYISTLCYLMEEAAKLGIKVIVFDRPNPINGLVVDGPVLEKQWRSFVGYLAVPLCHGMTMGELAQFFNQEYKIGCLLEVIPMKGWRRKMTFAQTGLPWVPMSPHIPEDTTPLFYGMTNLVPEVCHGINHGIGYTLPFKILGAPWIKGRHLAKELNQRKLPGVAFFPFHYRCFYGQYRNKDCQGVRIVITDHTRYRPVAVQFIILEVLKKLYPTHFLEGIAKLKAKRKSLMATLASDKIFQILCSDQKIGSRAVESYQKELKAFLTIRKKYLIHQY